MPADVIDQLARQLVEALGPQPAAPAVTLGLVLRRARRRLGAWNQQDFARDHLRARGLTHADLRRLENDREPNPALARLVWEALGLVVTVEGARGLASWTPPAWASVDRSSWCSLCEMAGLLYGQTAARCDHASRPVGRVEGSAHEESELISLLRENRALLRRMLGLLEAMESQYSSCERPLEILCRVEVTETVTPMRDSGAGCLEEESRRSGRT